MIARDSHPSPNNINMQLYMQLVSKLKNFDEGLWRIFFAVGLDGFPMALPWVYPSLKKVTFPEGSTAAESAQALRALRPRPWWIRRSVWFHHRNLPSQRLSFALGSTSYPAPCVSLVLWQHWAVVNETSDLQWSARLCWKDTSMLCYH